MIDNQECFFYWVRLCFVFLFLKIVMLQVVYVLVFLVFFYLSMKSVSLWVWDGEGGVWLCYVLKGKKEEFFFVLVYDIFSYVERKLRILQVMGEVYSVFLS